MGQIGPRLNGDTVFFDKVKAAIIAAIVLAVGAALTSIAGADWPGIIESAPGPEYLKALVLIAITNGLPLFIAWWKRETTGYGIGVPRPDGQ